MSWRNLFSAIHKYANEFDSQYHALELGGQYTKRILEPHEVEMLEAFLGLLARVVCLFEGVFLWVATLLKDTDSS